MSSKVYLGLKPSKRLISLLAFVLKRASLGHQWEPQVVKTFTTKRNNEQ